MIPAAVHCLIVIGIFAGVACMGIYGLINTVDWITAKYGRQNA